SDQNLQRPAIRDNVVHGDQQHVVLCSHTNQLPANQRAVLQIEAAADFLLHPPLKLGRLLLMTAEVVLLQIKAAIRDRYPLHWMSAYMPETGAQCFMPPHNPV